MESNKNSVYYGVHIPADVQTQDNEDCINVFQVNAVCLCVWWGFIGIGLFRINQRRLNW